MAYKTKSKAEDTLFSKAIRERDKWTCQRCKKKYPDTYPANMGLHCSHFIGRGHSATRFHPDNCDALCFGCHQQFETQKATDYRDWKIAQLGEKRFQELVEQGRRSVPRGAYETKLIRQFLKKNGLNGLTEFLNELWP